MTYYTTKTSF